MTTTNLDAKKDTKISISIPTHAYFISWIRDFTMNLVKNMTGFSEKWAYRLQAIIDELCNNAIEHWSKGDKDIYISFETIKWEVLRLTVEDTWTSDKPKTADQMKDYLKTKLAEQAKNTMAFSIRGRGISQIIYSWSDTLEFLDSDKGWLKVQITKNIKKEEI